FLRLARGAILDPKRPQIRDSLEEVVELLRAFRVVLRREGKIKEALLEASIRAPCVRTASGAPREREELLRRHVDLVVERAARHRLKQPPRRQEGVGLGPAQLDLSR